MKPSSLLTRLVVGTRAPLAFTLDGRACSGFEGDTVLTAVLALADHVRRHETSGAPQVGFCAIGACQDCWMDLADGRRVRACTTPLEAGMALLSGDAR